jgi:hypothetical protein
VPRGTHVCGLTVDGLPFAAGAGNAHPDGELALARAAAAAGTLFSAAFYSGHTMDAIRAAADSVTEGSPLLLQLYPPRKPIKTKSGRGDAGLDRAYMEIAIKYVAELKFVGVIITVDTVNNSNREKSYKNPEWIRQIADECGGFPEVGRVDCSLLGLSCSPFSPLFCYFSTRPRSRQIVAVPSETDTCADHSSPILAVLFRCFRLS